MCAVRRAQCRVTTPARGVFFVCAQTNSCCAVCDFMRPSLPCDGIINASNTKIVHTTRLAMYCSDLHCYDGWTQKSQAQCTLYIDDFLPEKSTWGKSVIGLVSVCTVCFGCIHSTRIMRYYNKHRRVCIQSSVCLFAYDSYPRVVNAAKHVDK